MDMACRLHHRHPRGCAFGFEEGLRGPDSGGKGRLLGSGKVPPAGHMTTGRKGEPHAVADQDDLGVAFHDGAGGGIAYSAGRVA